MKVLVIGHLTGKDIRPHLQAEGRRVAAKEPLRVKEVLVNEGDLTRPGQVLGT